MARRGWVRLVERADIWIDLRAPGDEVHGVWLFRCALEAVATREYFRQRAAEARAKSIHHNEAAEAEKEAA